MSINGKHCSNINTAVFKLNSRFCLAEYSAIVCWIPIRAAVRIAIHNMPYKAALMLWLYKNCRAIKKKPVKITTKASRFCTTSNDLKAKPNSNNADMASSEGNVKPLNNNPMIPTPTKPNFQLFDGWLMPLFMTRNRQPAENNITGISQKGRFKAKGNMTINCAASSHNIPL